MSLEKEEVEIEIFDFPIGPWHCHSPKKNEQPSIQKACCRCFSQCFMQRTSSHTRVEKYGRHGGPSTELQNRTQPPLDVRATNQRFIELIEKNDLYSKNLISNTLIEDM